MLRIIVCIMTLMATANIAAAEQTHRMLIINEVGKTMAGLDIAPTKTPAVNQNVLVDRDIEGIGQAEVTFKGPDGECIFTLMAVFSDDQIVVSDPVNVCKTDTFAFKP
ncbi:hypothetical protein [Phyllobacterium sp. YR531]|uniref:hypothetical protein n=1 Tax=Phyllobacterium sp. YR531 TaxID=1144343 RepID=UPI00026FC427|nr:hypothetical protein [Phyllobacterium sp. YR531]EJM99460.1 hypothetical protein PMI41_04367 [Phyllobacterium sp. YR531]